MNGCSEQLSLLSYSLTSSVAKNIMFFLRVSLEEIPLGHKSQRGLSTLQHECAQQISWQSTNVIM